MKKHEVTLTIAKHCICTFVFLASMSQNILQFGIEGDLISFMCLQFVSPILWRRLARVRKGKHKGKGRLLQQLLHVQEADLPNAILEVTLSNRCNGQSRLNFVLIQCLIIHRTYLIRSPHRTCGRF